MHRNKSVMTHDFSMVPKADIPRSAFSRPSAFKTTFDSGKLIPVFLDEVLPGDTFKLKATMFARLTTPIFPIMDNMRLNTFFFFVPNRILWYDWEHFMGQRDFPDDDIDFLIPQVDTSSGTEHAWRVQSIWDYFGIPIGGGNGATFNPPSFSALFPRAYNKIWNEWFRDENLQDPVPLNFDEAGPDNPDDYVLMRRGKRHDYFTSSLPWPQKGDAVTIPLTGNAPVRGMGFLEESPQGAVAQDWTVFGSGDTVTSTLHGFEIEGASAGINAQHERHLIVKEGATNFPDVYADLSAVTAATINSLRQSFQIQKLLERDARGGTRYTEIIRAHFGVISPDARLQRPEYLGGGITPININPIAQTSATSLDGGDTPLGTLAAMGTVTAHNQGFTQSFTEHGIIMGLVEVDADLTYQQGLNRMWNRSTRYDFYFPAFAMLGEQTVLNQEIYAADDSSSHAQNIGVFGYQERWAEYRYKPSLITGQFRSNLVGGSLDGWHLAQNFGSLPTLGDTFIQDNPPVSRIIADQAEGAAQFYLDCFFDLTCVRPMPMYSVPGLIDHF